MREIMINASKQARFFFFCLDRFKIAPDAPALVGLRIAVVAVKTMMQSTPAASTETAQNPADSAMSVTH